MRIETILNAMVLSRIFAKPREISTRQYHAFRDRILMMFDAKEMHIQLQHMKISSQRERIAELEETIREMRGFL